MDTRRVSPFSSFSPLPLPERPVSPEERKHPPGDANSKLLQFARLCTHSLLANHLAHTPAPTPAGLIISHVQVSKGRSRVTPVARSRIEHLGKWHKRAQHRHGAQKGRGRCTASHRSS